MDIVGYADRLSALPGESVQFMVSCTGSTFRADLVRLIHGDANPDGPGFKERPIVWDGAGDYPGRVQTIHPGSYVAIRPDSPIAVPPDLTFAAWIFPTLPGTGPQGLITLVSQASGRGIGLVLDEAGCAALWIRENDEDRFVSSGVPVRPHVWTFVAAAFTAESGDVQLRQQPRRVWPEDTSGVATGRTSGRLAPLDTASAIVLAGICRHGRTEPAYITGHFNGKLDTPRILVGNRSQEQLASMATGGELSLASLLAAWDFSREIGTNRIVDVGPRGLHGVTVNLPARAMTGHDWTGDVVDHTKDPSGYGAIHFHHDDLDDARWQPDVSLSIPAGTPSGIYALRVRTGGAEDHIPFVVRPPLGRPSARIAFLLPTNTYLAYANEQGTSGEDSPSLALPRGNAGVDAVQVAYLAENRLLSLYDYHADGSGVSTSSRLRPILNMRPQARSRHIDAPHAMPADLYLVDWLDHEGFDVDVITDEDLHREGRDLLSPYRCILTGSHPEYWSGRMLDALEAYLGAGGRLMYLGGNGFYWVTSYTPGLHAIEVRRWGGTGSWRANPGEYYHATTAELGGLWRNRGRAPQGIVGIGFSAQGFDAGRPYKRTDASYSDGAAWVFDGVPEGAIGDVPNLILGHGAAGHEVDRADSHLGTPSTATILATATGFSDGYQGAIEDCLMSDSMQGGTVNPRVRADMTLVEYPNGGAVFSVGSIAWCGSLSAHDYANGVSAITANVLHRFSSLA